LSTVAALILTAVVTHEEMVLDIATAGLVRQGWPRSVRVTVGLDVNR
jgi:hypothetical protein